MHGAAIEQQQEMEKTVAESELNAVKDTIWVQRT